MSRQKKSRKPGLIGARKASEPRETEQVARERKKLKKRKGLQPGSRHGQNAGSGKGASSKTRATSDPRLGSTKPVPLVNTPLGQVKSSDSARPAPVVTAKAPAAKQPSLSPQQELERLEQDERLNALLDRVDGGEILTDTEQAWLDAQLARHHELMVLLGLEQEEFQEDDEDALLERFTSQEWSMDDEDKR